MRKCVLKNGMAQSVSLSALSRELFAYAHSRMSTFVVVFAPAGWVYLWTAQTETMMHINMSSREKKRGEITKLKPASAPCCPPPGRRENARRGTLLLDLLHMFFYSYFPLQVYFLWAPWQLWFCNLFWRLLSFCFLTCPHHLGKEDEHYEVGPCSKADVCPSLCLSSLPDDCASISPTANMKVVSLGQRWLNHKCLLFCYLVKI